ncbi:PD-(D/E)XK nuclease family protein [Paraburkholderia sp. GAS82]|uniref:PD-(D/E)XK nuclease family protein n=1 Tax=Paraburkholderia sp. GAS82 TaxID=3035137 RepID=UPI003D24930F
MPNFADVKSLLDVLHDPLAVRLRARWKSFNPFRVLKVEKRELRHTTTLAWLLDPRENHGLGDHFLRGFLKSVCEAASDHTTLLRYETDSNAIVRVHAELQMQQVQRDRIIPDFDEDRYSDVPVNAALERGKRRIDLLVEGQGWAVAIEAKIGASEGEGQLDAYRTPLRLWAQQTDRELLLIYLTIDEQDSRGDDWINAQWSKSVAQPLRTVLAASGESGQLGDQQHAFLASYLDILSDVADDADGFVNCELSELASHHTTALRCLKEAIKASDHNAPHPANWIVLYERNKRLLDPLLEYVDLGFEARAKMIIDALRTLGLTRVKGDNSYVRFIVTDWVQRFPRIYDASDRQLPRVLYEIRNDSKQPHKIFVALQIWLLDDTVYTEEVYLEDRVSIVREIQADDRVSDFPRLFARGKPKQQLNQKVQALVSTSIACNIEAPDAMYFVDKLNEFVSRTSKQIEEYLERFREGNERTAA